MSQAKGVHFFMCKEDYKTIPIGEKFVLSVPEAAALTGIGQNKIDTMLREADCPFLLLNGNRRLIKRDKFIEFINEAKQI